ncbi:MAG: 30S ribosome-binding factor RbfA [Acidobacteria bacterium]|nr:30S ribosome-binding factor RbfA [Acidobacteriota bacterium]MCA1651115.1 30S ribosome-binding factor RbfA [Acidobacteriota bacterium]
MPLSPRAVRVGDQLRVEITEILARDVHDPGIGFLTITRVKVTPDLQQAKVYYTTLGDAKARTDTGKALGRATPFLRRQVARRMNFKRVPELQFFYDESIEQHDRIERILQEIQAERAEAPQPNEPTTGDDGSDH